MQKKILQLNQKKLLKIHSNLIMPINLMILSRHNNLMKIAILILILLINNNNMNNNNNNNKMKISHIDHRILVIHMNQIANKDKITIMEDLTFNSLVSLDFSLEDLEV